GLPGAFSLPPCAGALGGRLLCAKAKCNYSVTRVTGRAPVQFTTFALTKVEEEKPRTGANGHPTVGGFAQALRRRRFRVIVARDLEAPDGRQPAFPLPFRR